MIDIDAHMNYQLACSVGILDKYMARNSFQIIQDCVDFNVLLVKQGDVSVKKII